MLEPIKRSGQFYNVMSTLCRHVDTAKQIRGQADHVMGDISTIALREQQTFSDVRRECDAF